MGLSQLALTVSESSQVAEARRNAGALAARLGFSEARAGTVALVVTEASTNLIKHANGGTVLVQPLERDGEVGVEVIAIDAGPGIANLRASLRDGHSSAGSPGLGLGGIARQGANFEVYTQPGAGTVIRCEIWPGETPPAPREIESGVVCVAKSGESVSGDGWLLHEDKGRYILLVVDGLGHGPDAAAAAALARAAVMKNAARTPAEQIDAVHGALRASRGAAAAVVELKPALEVGAFCGIGNIACFTRVEGKTRNLVSQNGTLGHQVRKIQEYAFPFPRQALLYAFSDGMTSRWDPGAYPGLEQRHPALIAGALYRDHSRGRDDTTLAVLRNLRKS